MIWHDAFIDKPKETLYRIIILFVADSKYCDDWYCDDDVSLHIDEGFYLKSKDKFYVSWAKDGLPHNFYYAIAWANFNDINIYNDGEHYRLNN